MARHVVAACAKTLQQARFRLKTSMGITDEFYQHCVAYPIHGTGQGSGNSPQIWCFVCSVLFDAFASATDGATFTSYDGSRSITLHMVGFVDDCSQRTNNFSADPQPTAAVFCPKMREDVQLWTDLLWASGGANELIKYSFHLIESDHKPSGEPFLRGDKTAPNIYLVNGLVPSQVKQRSNYQSHKTLGCHVNPAQLMTKQRQTLKAKSDDYTDSMATNVFVPKEASTLYNSMSYPTRRAVQTTVRRGGAKRSP
jgi:hypothetical protein